MDFDTTGLTPETSAPTAAPVAFDPTGATPEPPMAASPVPDHEDPAHIAGWNSLSPLGRAKALVTHFWPTFKAHFAEDHPILAHPAEAAPALGATGGQIIGAPFEEFGGMHIGGALGGGLGDAIKQITDMASGQQQGFKFGELTGNMIAGAVPGSSLVGAPAKQVIVQGAKYAASNLLAKTAETTIDESRMPTLGEAAIATGSGMVAAPASIILDQGSNLAAQDAKKMMYAIRDKTLSDARAAGFVVPPSRINPSALNNTLESIGGKAAIGQQASLDNQQIVNKLAKKAIGIPVDEPITPQAIQDIRTQARKAYQDVAALSPDMAAELENLKQARYEKNLQYSYYQRSGNPDALKAAKAAEAIADQKESLLEAGAQLAGKPELVKDLRDSRVLIAKTYNVENALNAADGNISASVLGRQFDNGKPLTGELAIIGRFQQAFPAYARDASAITSPGISKLKVGEAAVAGAYGAQHFGPAGSILAAAPFMDNAARGLSLSRAYQASRFANPNYGTALPDSYGNLTRFLLQQGGRQPPPSLPAPATP